MNVEDIHNVTFDKVMRGYRTEDVDAYLDQVAAELERLQTEKADLEKKMYILAEKVDQYRSDEETLKTAMLNAQRMGESVIHEARQKAETILYDATNKANLARDEAVEKVAEQELLLSRLKAEVACFKSNILNLYKQHIESLSLLPGAEKAKTEKEEPEEGSEKEPKQDAPEETPKQEPAQESEAPSKEESPAEADAMESYQGISFED